MTPEERKAVDLMLRDWMREIERRLEEQEVRQSRVEHETEILIRRIQLEDAERNHPRRP